MEAGQGIIQRPMHERYDTEVLALRQHDVLVEIALTVEQQFFDAGCMVMLAPSIDQIVACFLSERRDQLALTFALSGQERHVQASQLFEFIRQRLIHGEAHHHTGDGQWRPDLGLDHQVRLPIQ